jgi:isopropylmalate/homocitrate/citramalate synthase
MFSRLGGPKGMIRQSEFFLYTERDKEAVRLCQEKGLRFPEITGWIRAQRNDFRIVKELGLKEVGILTSASDYHIFLKLRTTRAKVMQQYLYIAESALDEGIIPRCHFEDITRADFYGFVVPFASALMSLAERYKSPVKIRLCDTMGYGVPYPGASLPRSVPGIVYGMQNYGNVPSKWLEWHGHNDFHKALVNASTAWLYGCSAANCAIFGLGERTGNPPLEGMAVEYAMLRGGTNGMDLKVITELYEYYQKELKAEIPARYPLVGEDFNVTRAGIHADGLEKNPEIYNAFDTEKILGRPFGVSIADKCGIAGIAAWINQHYALEEKKRINKSDAAVTAIKEWVDAQYKDGRTTVIATAEMVEQVKKHLPKVVGLA